MNRVTETKELHERNYSRNELMNMTADDLGALTPFSLGGFSVRSGIFLCLVISRVEQIRKDKEKFGRAR